MKKLLVEGKKYFASLKMKFHMKSIKEKHASQIMLGLKRILWKRQINHR